MSEPVVPTYLHGNPVPVWRHARTAVQTRLGDQRLKRARRVHPLQCQESCPAGQAAIDERPLGRHIHFDRSCRQGADALEHWCWTTSHLHPVQIESRREQRVPVDVRQKRVPLLCSDNAAVRAALLHDLRPSHQPASGS